VQRLLLEEIGRLVQSAKRDGETLRTGYHAGQLASAFPHAFSLGRIVDELIRAATKEGVSVEIARPDDAEPHF
jgi:hypothetical protein